MKDINSEYTKIISKYINNGYIIIHNNMNTVYNNVLCFIDLVHPKNTNTLIRVWMFKSYEDLSEFENSEVSTLIISTKQYNINNNIEPVWLVDGIVLDELKLYEVDQDTYTYDLDFIRKVVNLKNKRKAIKPKSFINCRKHFSVSKLPNNFTSKIVERIHQNYGCKRAKSDSIKEVYIIKDSNSKLEAVVSWKYRNHEGLIRLK